MPCSRIGRFGGHGRITIGGASTSAVTLGIDEYLIVLAGGSLALGGGLTAVGSTMRIA